ncbi:MAG: hypothetical protein ACYC8T_16825 [Myxococcaceae bacterium]
MKRLLAVLTLCLVPAAFAQGKPPRPADAPAVRQIDFGEGSDIIGEGDGPDVALFDEPRPVTHSSLIRVREDFKAEVMRSVDDLP